MKVIFLDIDGVLNSQRSCMAFGGFPWPGKHKERSWEKFDSVAIGLLRRITTKTGAVCVLSSTWRLGADDAFLSDLSAHLGVQIVGMTRSTYLNEVRGNQIQDWLNENPEVERWCILDDDSDMLPEQMDNFVKVNYQDGLSYQNHLDVIRILGGEVA